MKMKSTLTIKGLYILAIFLLSASGLLAGEGMWLPLLLESLNESEMKSMGMKMNAEDIYNVNQGSLKDAVILFNGNCTGAVVSDQGLIFTNHHCGYSAIQDLSTIEHNYLTEGFWANSLAEEIPKAGMYVTFIQRMQDVTQEVLQNVSAHLTPGDRQRTIDKNISKLRELTPRESYQDILVRSFFEGNAYYLFVTESYRDIRYVGSPPESIGRFGADTDNWVWPRHTGDFSVFRIYAGPDNRPAAYAPENKPYHPRHFFPISMDGVQDGDFTMVYGFPAKTNEYLPSYAITQFAELIDPARIDVRTISLGIMDKYMRKDDRIRLAYASKYASLSNSWKKWIGERLGLQSKHAADAKAREELEFTQRLAADPALKQAYGDLLPGMKSLYAALDPIVKTRTMLVEVLSGSNIELFKVAGWCDRLKKAYIESGEPGFQDAFSKLAPVIDDFYNEYHVEVDREVYDALLEYLQQHLPAQYMPDQLQPVSDQNSAMMGLKRVTDIMSLTSLSSKETFLSLMQQGGENFMYRMDLDQGYLIYSVLKQVLDVQISPEYNSLSGQLNDLQEEYMKALMMVSPEKRFWPDANFTLRVSYGQVEAFAPKDGMMYKTQTYLDGVMEKYVPGDYEFDVNPKLIALYNAKDYGPYGENGKMPVCFLGSNHTTGGNSGSPAIDAYGNLIGLNFDRVWEGTMSDLYYDRSICRNIMVDVRYVLFIIDKYAGATHLIRELKLVHPKAGKKGKKKNKRKR